MDSPFISCVVSTKSMTFIFVTAAGHPLAMALNYITFFLTYDKRKESNPNTHRTLHAYPYIYSVVSNYHPALICSHHSYCDYRPQVVRYLLNMKINFNRHQFLTAPNKQ